MKPMLAFKYNDKKAKVKWPVYVQPKLDGVRAVYHPATKELVSRDDKVFDPKVAGHIYRQLTKIPSHIFLDGELYCHGWRLQEINGAISVNRKTPTAHTIEVEYHVFDCFVSTEPDLPFSERILRLHDIFSELEVFVARDLSARQKIKLVNTFIAKTPEAMEYFFADFRAQRYEGLMLRQDRPYGLSSACSNKENRWDSLLKRKDWLDDWFTCTGFDFGEGKYSEVVGSLKCETSAGVSFNVGSGLLDLDRELFAQSPPTEVKVQYETLSADGAPLKPVFLEAR